MTAKKGNEVDVAVKFCAVYLRSRLLLRQKPSTSRCFSQQIKHLLPECNWVGFSELLWSVVSKAIPAIVGIRITLEAGKDGN